MSLKAGFVAIGDLNVALGHRGISVHDPAQGRFVVANCSPDDARRVARALLDAAEDWDTVRSAERLLGDGERSLYETILSDDQRWRLLVLKTEEEQRRQAERLVTRHTSEEGRCSAS